MDPLLPIPIFERASPIVNSAEVKVHRDGSPFGRSNGIHDGSGLTRSIASCENGGREPGSIRPSLTKFSGTQEISTSSPTALITLSVSMLRYSPCTGTTLGRPISSGAELHFLENNLQPSVVLSPDGRGLDKKFELDSLFLGFADFIWNSRHRFFRSSIGNRYFGTEAQRSPGRHPWQYCRRQLQGSRLPGKRSCPELTFSRNSPPLQTPARPSPSTDSSALSSAPGERKIASNLLQFVKTNVPPHPATGS